VASTVRDLAATPTGLVSRLAFGRRRPGTNLPARPATVGSARQLYLIAADAEFREHDDASLRLVLADDFERHSATAEPAIFGTGGPAVGTATAADWIARVEASAVWRHVVESGKLRYAVLE